MVTLENILSEKLQDKQTREPLSKGDSRMGYCISYSATHTYPCLTNLIYIFFSFLQM